MDTITGTPITDSDYRTHSHLHAHGYVHGDTDRHGYTEHHLDGHLLSRRYHIRDTDFHANVNRDTPTYCDCK
ncbi:MAG: hypothetical protein M3P06_11515 [Acidobacteriota bacterium]|nr:hypothetical protein [Acidobacteriota bacterium]